jgi:glucosyl-3-phosphoglycerate synthase
MAMINERFRGRMVVFDMDNTLLQDRFIDVCAERFRFTQALVLIRQIDKDPVSITRRIAYFLKDIPQSELLATLDSIPLVEDSLAVIKELKRRSNIIGIISDSYQLITQIVAEKVDADFYLANELEIDFGQVTGQVLIPSYFHYSDESTCKHQVCKTNALRYIAKKYGMELEDCVYVGDSANDICAVQHAGLGISFCSNNEQLRVVAKRSIEKRAFSELLEFLG